MNDLEVTRLCAEAMGYSDIHVLDHLVFYRSGPSETHSGINRAWMPLRDDAQAMMLVKKFELEIIPPPLRAKHDWRAVFPATEAGFISKSSVDLNRAICECVAKMQAAKVVA